MAVADRLDASIVVAATTVRMPRELDCSTDPRLRSEIALAVAVGSGNVVLDCEPLVFIDAGGVGTLVWAANLTAGTGRGVTLLDAGPAMRRLLHVTRVEHRFTLEAT